MQCLQVLSILCVLTAASRTWAVEQTIPKSQEEKRIAFGKEFNREDYPYVVFIATSNHDSDNTFSICTGTLLSPVHVLTAAHCFPHEKKPSDYEVFRGLFVDGSQHPTEIYSHPLYAKSKIGDVSVMKLKGPLPGVDRFISISGHPDEFAGGKELNCVNIGFGATETGGHPVHGLIINVTARYYENCFHRDNPVLGKQFLCGKIDTHRPCHGDSGGPLICNGFQYGTVSKNIKRLDGNTNSDCGTLDAEDEYVFLYVYKDWIMDCLNSCPMIRPDKCCIFISFYLVVILFTFLECI